MSSTVSPKIRSLFPTTHFTFALLSSDYFSIWQRPIRSLSVVRFARSATSATTVSCAAVRVRANPQLMILWLDSMGETLLKWVILYKDLIHFTDCYIGQKQENGVDVSSICKKGVSVKYPVLLSNFLNFPLHAWAAWLAEESANLKKNLPKPIYVGQSQPAPTFLLLFCYKNIVQTIT